MKIDNPNPLLRPGQTPPREPAQKVDGPARADQQTTASGATTHLSAAATDDSQDIDGARVEEIREAIRDGRLEVRAERIADGLIDSVRDLLGDRDA